MSSGDGATWCAGIVRAARRPPGWRAPGPPPLVPASRPDLWPGRDEDLCGLAGDWRILQRVDGHRWSLDDLVTAWCAATRAGADPPRRIADLGCGVGSVLLLLAWRFPATRGVGVEAQALSVGLARRSIAWNGVAGRCEVRHGDLRDPDLLPEAGTFALVTGTPPYLPPGSATEAARVQRGPCRIEHRGGIEVYCAAAARLLAPDAPFVVCAAAGQHARVARAAAAAGLTIATRLDVVPRLGKPPLFAVHVMVGGAERAPEVLPALVVRDGEGRRTPAFRALRAEMGMPP
jgi:tRNA1Val (adenine37-N6)-methyltransferase